MSTSFMSRRIDDEASECEYDTDFTPNDSDELEGQPHSCNFDRREFPPED